MTKLVLSVLVAIALSTALVCARASEANVSVTKAPPSLPW